MNSVGRKKKKMESTLPLLGLDLGNVCDTIADANKLLTISVTENSGIIITEQRQGDLARFLGTHYRFARAARRAAMQAAGLPVIPNRN